MSWNPATGLAYANTLNIAWPYQLAKQEYKKEGYEMFMQMTWRVKSAVIGNLLRLQVARQESAEEIEQKRLAAQQIVRATMNYVASAGLLGDFLDAASAASGSTSCACSGVARTSSSPTPTRNRWATPPRRPAAGTRAPSAST